MSVQQKPVIHGRDHLHGGPDPAWIVYEDVGGEFPVDAARVTTSIATAVTPWAVNLPGSITAGDLLLLLARTGGVQTLTTPGGWTALVANNTADGSDDATCLFYRYADGSEGASLSVTPSAAAKGAAIAWRITGAINPATQPPEVTILTTGAGINSNPPAITPTGGSKNYLFFAMVGLDSSSALITTAPVGYSNLVSENSGAAGTGNSNVRVGGASKQAAASSEDPNTFIHGTSLSGNTVLTVVVHPS